MDKDGEFVDYYAILEISPDCETSALEAAFRLLAKRYHPDHVDTADVARFGAVIDAYKVLKNPEQRAHYDVLYSHNTGFHFAEPEIAEEEAALSDAEAHRKLLQFLYKRRREQAQDPGVGRYYAQELLNCPDEAFEFHLWYLKAKGYIVTTEQGTLAITIEGVDQVIAESRSAQQERRLLTQGREARRPAGF